MWFLNIPSTAFFHRKPPAISWLSFTRPTADISDSLWHFFTYQWIGSRENLNQQPWSLPPTTMAFVVLFFLAPIQWIMEHHRLNLGQSSNYMGCFPVRKLWKITRGHPIHHPNQRYQTWSRMEKSHGINHTPRTSNFVNTLAAGHSDPTGHWHVSEEWQFQAARFGGK